MARGPPLNFWLSRGVLEGLTFSLSQSRVSHNFVPVYIVWLTQTRGLTPPAPSSLILLSAQLRSFLHHVSTRLDLDNNRSSSNSKSTERDTGLLNCSSAVKIRTQTSNEWSVGDILFFQLAVVPCLAYSRFVGYREVHHAW